jgi:tellurite resistance protein TerC
MPNAPLLPISQYWWLYAAFVAFVLVMLAIDLGLLNRKAKDISIASATRWTIVWCTLALVFNGALWLWLGHELAKPEFAAALTEHRFDSPASAARQLSFEFLSGYIIEVSLSVDNLFVFLVLFGYFSVPAEQRHRVLFYGIIGALVCRGAFIALGSVLFRFHFVVIIFGVILAITGVRLVIASDDHGPNPERNPIIRLLRRFLPVTDGYRGNHFFVREAGHRFATPLFVTLVAVELTDIVFAIDSIPAIYGITREPLIVFTSNVFAILGLRSLFFVLAGAVDKFHLLRYGLGLVLVFVGLKMTLLDHFTEDGKFPIEWSLGIIIAVLGLSIGASLLIPKRAAPTSERTPDA